MKAEELLRDRYELLHVLGSGTGGSVYKALQLSTKQTVAVKLLSSDGVGGDVQSRRLERFRREISLCSQLYHPDIVRLLDSGQLENGIHFAAFEFIPGITLAELLNEQGMLKLRRARSLMLQLLSPLTYAHAKGIFHRDLKPSNIMVTSDQARDRLKILDFGISIATHQENSDVARLTLSHEWVGTPTYAAPEQLRGEPPGAKADLYAWGLIFLECLTGSPVVTGRTMPEIIQQHLTTAAHRLPAALRQHRLGGLLSWVLEKNPARRASEASTLLEMTENISVDDIEDAHGYLRDLAADGVRRRSWPVPSDTLTDERRPEQVELRQATVVCCKIGVVGDDRASNIDQLDTLVEDTNALAREIMGQFGANICQSFGEYSLCYFGLWRARDADTRLALRAALELIGRLERSPTWLTDQGMVLRGTIGIHNGPVTIRLHEGTRRQVDGQTSGMAMALAALGESATDAALPRVFVSNDFRGLVARHAEFERFGAVLDRGAPGVDSTRSAYRLVKEARPSATSNLSERSVFVGREAELDLLLAAHEQTRAPAAVRVLISGEPGIGKSRLVREARFRSEALGVEWLEARCLPEWQNAFLRPLATLFLQLLGIAGQGSAEAGLLVERTVDDLELKGSEAVPLLCMWLSVALPAGYAPLTWSPQKQREMLHALVADILIKLMARGAILSVEDLHWADPSTLECLNVLFERARARPSMIIMTTRPDQRFSWSVEPQHMVLNRLDETAVTRLAAALVSDGVADHRVVAHIVERSDGVPLFVEELAMAFRGEVPPGHGTFEDHSAAGLDARAVPPSLRDLLTSRLDDVGDARRIAQFASVLGREFPLEILAVLSDTDETALLADLEQLLDAEILIRRTRGVEPVYVFRHALIRDAAYDGMPMPARRRAHERVAEGLALHFPELADAQPDVLAQHWELAGQEERAIAAWKLAATKSAMASAHFEALDQISRALSLLQRLPESPTRVLNEADLLLTRGATLVGKRGYADPEAVMSFERAVQLLPAGGEALEQAFAARWGLWYYHQTQANLPRSCELAAELLALAQQARAPALSVSAWEAICETSFCVGRFDDSVDASRRCEADYDFDAHRHLSTIRGDDPHLASLSFEAFAELLRGQYGAAVARADQGLALAERLSYPAMKAAMHSQAAWLYLVLGGSGATNPNLERARAHAGAAIGVAHEHGFPFWEIYAVMIDAGARILLGDLSAIDQLRQGSELWRAGGAGLGRCWQLTFIAEGLRRLGQHEQALATLNEALEFCDGHDSRYFEPEVRRVRAEVLIDASNPRRDVDAGLQECAIASAKAAQQGASWWVLASCMTGARVPLETRSDRIDYAAQ